MDPLLVDAQVGPSPDDGPDGTALRGPEAAVFAGAPWRRRAVPLALLIAVVAVAVWVWLVAAGLDPAGITGPDLIHRLQITSLHRAGGAVRA